MTIIKHGNPKERLHFGCPDCGCEWKARVGEAKDDDLVKYQMKCPDCGYNTASLDTVYTVFHTPIKSEVKQ